MSRYSSTFERISSGNEDNEGEKCRFSKWEEEMVACISTRGGKSFIKSLRKLKGLKSEGMRMGLVTSILIGSSNSPRMSFSLWNSIEGEKVKVFEE